MKRLFFALVIVSNSILVNAQQLVSPGDQIPPDYFITRTREEYLKKVMEMPFGVKTDDPVKIIAEKMLAFVKSYQPQIKQYPDDYYARESNLEAAISIKEGGYGIGAVLIDASGKIIARNHNQQMQRNRSDLHGEMALLTDFEESRHAKKYMNLYVFKPGLTVFSSAEPCPMCFIRLASAGVNTRYCTPGPDDGMVTRISCLPPYWSEMANKYKFEKANSSPVMQKTAHLLFYSYLLDNRGPN